MQRGNLTLIEGRNTVLDSLKSNRNIKIIYIDKGAKKESTKVGDLILLAKSKKIPVLFKDRRFLDKISISKDHQGILAQAEKRETYTIEQFCKKSILTKEPCVVLLKSVIHPQNLGAVIRSLSAFGVDAVVISKNNDPDFMTIVEKNSMGAFSDVAVIQSSFHSALSVLKKSGFKLVAFENSANKPLFEENLQGRVALIFGGESDMLKEDTLKVVDSFVKIPMHSKISSLNLSVAVSIACYERGLQNKKNESI